MVGLASPLQHSGHQGGLPTFRSTAAECQRFRRSVLRFAKSQCQKKRIATWKRSTSDALSELMATLETREPTPLRLSQVQRVALVSTSMFAARSALPASWGTRRTPLQRRHRGRFQRSVRPRMQTGYARVSDVWPSSAQSGRVTLLGLSSGPGFSLPARTIRKSTSAGFDSTFKPNVITSPSLDPCGLVASKKAPSEEHPQTGRSTFARPRCELPSSALSDRRPHTAPF